MKKLFSLLVIFMLVASGYGQSSITVVAPNGGENWITGCPSVINWNVTNYTGTLKIELFKNNAFYMVICPQIPPAATSFSWMVPISVLPGNNYKVKISGITSVTLFDFSDTTFNINRGSITVQSPNGGENWVKGTTHPVLWNDNICENVRIELWKGGQYNSLIAASVPSNGSFTWVVPTDATLIPGNDYRVRIMSAATIAGSNIIVQDFSDTTFTISAPQNSAPIVIVTPNGGENLIMGCPAMIQWISAAATAGPFKIELYKNNLFHSVICAQTPSGMMNFTWMVPTFLTPGNDYKVKVSTLTSPPVFDFSDSTFAINRGFIQVISPNGGETWVKGTMHPIVWHDNLCSNVRIELWKAGAMHSVIANSVPSSGTFNWTIPNSGNFVTGNDYRVKIIEVAANSTATNLVYDYSDSAFSLIPPQNTGQITVVAPNGGENWIAGCPNQIQWAFTSTLASAVKLELYKDTLFYMTICPQVAAGMTTFSWVVPYSIIPGNNYKVKVTTLTSPAVFDFSNNPFSISRGGITVTSPNGGESWVKGTMHTVLWNDNLCDNVRIELWKAGVFHSVIAQSVPSTGSFNWNIPNVNTLVPGNDYKVRILTMANSAGTTSVVSDYSDSTFTIAAAPPSGLLTVVTPNGGENWIEGCPNVIQWVYASTNTGTIKIELYKNNVFNMLIASMVPSTQGTFTWMVPWGIVPGADYKIKISSLTSNSLFDFSDNNFSISYGGITVVSPNGGETWVKGTMHPVLWTDNLCDNVRIELWKGSAMYMIIAQSVPSNGVFNWYIPATPNLPNGNDYKIKIVALAPVAGTTILVADMSDNFFTIVGATGNGPGNGNLSVERVYPNPCSDNFNLVFAGNSDTPVTIGIFHRMGIMVQKKIINTVTEGEAVILNVENLSSGTYIYTVTSSDGTILRGRLMVQH